MFFVGHSSESKARIRQLVVDQLCAAPGGPQRSNAAALWGNVSDGPQSATRVANAVCKRTSGTAQSRAPSFA
jgi:hypothetical protein